MTLPDILGHAGYISIITGLVLLARQNKWGWLCRMFGDVIWLIVGILTGMTSLWFWGFFFLGIDIWGFRKWNFKAT
jgi:hypothetical protein